MPGVLAVDAPAYASSEETAKQIDILSSSVGFKSLDSIPLIVLCDDAGFTSETINNFVWVTFTRSNPSHDIHGINSFTENKHWGCRGPMIIDARIKPHHAPLLVKDPKVEKSIDELAKAGSSLHGII